MIYEILTLIASFYAIAGHLIAIELPLYHFATGYALASVIVFSVESIIRKSETKRGERNG